MSWEATAFSKKTRGHPNMSTRAVLLTLSDYHNHKLGYAFCSQATLADDCECSVRNIRAALAFLEKAGWITLTQKGNQFQPSHWVYNFDAALSYEQEVDGKLSQETEQEESAASSKPASEPEAQRKGQRKHSVSEAEAPANTNHKEPPQVTSPIKTFMTMLKDERGYESTNYGAEAKAVKGMDALGYSGADMLGCYQHLKKNPWWKEKNLTMMSVKSAIGEWKKHSQPTENKFQKDVDRLANRPMVPETSKRT